MSVHVEFVPHESGNLTLSMPPYSKVELIDVAEVGMLAITFTVPNAGAAHVDVAVSVGPEGKVFVDDECVGCAKM